MDRFLILFLEYVDRCIVFPLRKLYVIVVKEIVRIVALLLITGIRNFEICILFLSVNVLLLIMVVVF